MAELDNKLNDPLNTTPRVPSVGGALKQMQDITREQVQSTERLGQLEAEKLKQTPLIQKEKLEAEKAYRDVAAKEKESDIAAAERDMSQFKVSQDSITGMSALGTAILMLGQALGRSGGQQSAMGAIQGMTGMMQGYSKGRAEEFKRNQVEFERNFKILQDKIKRANDKFQAALAEMPYNTIEAQTKAAQALAELDSPILKEKYNKQGLVETAGFVSKLYDAAQESAKRAQALAIARAKGSTAGGGLNGRYAFNINEATQQAGADLLNIARMPAGTVLGTFSGMTGQSGDTLTSSLANTFARNVTDDDSRQMQQLVSGFDMNMARALGGGYANSGAKAAVQAYKEQVAREGDSPLAQATFLARAKQELAILNKAFKAHPGANEAEIAQMQDLNNTIAQVVPFTVQDVIAASGGKGVPNIAQASTSMVLPQTPTLQEFLDKAGRANPNMSIDQLKAKYNELYGGQ